MKVQRFQNRLIFFDAATPFINYLCVQSDGTRVQSVTVILFFSIIFEGAKLVVATSAFYKVFRTFVVCNAVLKHENMFGHFLPTGTT